MNIAIAIAPKATRREWIGLAVIALPCMLYSMDLTVLNLAVPTISAELKPTPSQLLWIIDIYGFMVAGMLMTMGTLGDRIGRRRLLMIGAVAFGIASVLAAFSTSAEMLIVMRAVLGIAGATVAPSTMSLIRNMFHDPHERTVAIGIWISSYSVGAAIGPLVGGVLLEYFWWGSVFLVSVPVMLLLLTLGPMLLPEYRDPNAGRLDLTSVAQSLTAVLATIYGLKRVAEDGWAWLPALSIAAGIAIGIAFIRRQQRLSDPLIDLRLFLAPVFSAALMVYTLATMAAFGIFVFIAQHLQLVLGMGPLEAGIWTTPFAVAFIVGSMITPILVRRIRPKYIMAAGLGIAASGFGMLAWFETPGPVLLVAAFFVYSLGLAPVFTLSADLIVSGAPPERAGSASAISETGSEFGGALGIAILGSLGTAVYRNLITMPAAVPPDLAVAARNTLGGAWAAAEQLPAEVGGALLHSARAAFAEGMQLAAAICAILMVVTAITTLVVLRHPRSNVKTGGAAGH